jgi:hypothetical protein
VSPLDGLRSAVRVLSWALAIGTVAAAIDAAILVAVVTAWPHSALLRAAMLLVSESVVVFALVWLAGLAIDLQPIAGALAGVWTALLPSLVVWAIEGPLGLEPHWQARVASLFLAAGAGAGAMLLHRRQARRTGSGPPSAPIE